MKKNIAMRVAAFLFILTMISTCAFATTFAKYTTSGTAADEARVAKWGVKVTAPNQDNLFAKEYNDKVVSSGDYDVVAPGTDGQLAKFVISGEAEVDVEVTYSATLTLANWKVGENEYVPLVITVNGTPYTGTSMEELKTKVEGAIKAVTESYDANTPISDVLEVSWFWALSGGSPNAHPKQNDTNDTLLGEAATGDKVPTIKLEVTCTVSQK